MVIFYSRLLNAPLISLTIFQFFKDTIKIIYLHLHHHFVTYTDNTIWIMIIQEKISNFPLIFCNTIIQVFLEVFKPYEFMRLLDYYFNRNRSFFKSFPRFFIFFFNKISV